MLGDHRIYLQTQENQLSLRPIAFLRSRIYDDVPIWHILDQVQETSRRDS